MRIFLISIFALATSLSSSICFANHFEKMDRELAEYKKELAHMGSWRLGYERAAKVIKVGFTCGATGIAGVASFAVESAPVASLVVKLLLGTQADLHPDYSLNLKFEEDKGHSLYVLGASALLGGAVVSVSMAALNAGKVALDSESKDQQEAKGFFKTDSVVSYLGTAMIVDGLIKATKCDQSLKELSVVWNAEAAREKVVRENTTSETMTSHSGSMFDGKKVIITSSSSEFIPGPAVTSISSERDSASDLRNSSGEE
ncbi:MAG: hypothetical protein AABZ55_12495 [Bdellovibrionota bacterium]